MLRLDEDLTTPTTLFESIDPELDDKLQKELELGFGMICQAYFSVVANACFGNGTKNRTPTSLLNEFYRDLQLYCVVFCRLVFSDTHRTQIEEEMRNLFASPMFSRREVVFQSETEKNEHERMLRREAELAKRYAKQGATRSADHIAAVKKQTIIESDTADGASGASIYVQQMKSDAELNNEEDDLQAKGSKSTETSSFNRVEKGAATSMASTNEAPKTLHWDLSSPVQKRQMNRAGAISERQAKESHLSDRNSPVPTNLKAKGQSSFGIPNKEKSPASLRSSGKIGSVSSRKDTSKASFNRIQSSSLQTSSSSRSSPSVSSPLATVQKEQTKRTPTSIRSTPSHSPVETFRSTKQMTGLRKTFTSGASDRSKQKEQLQRSAGQRPIVSGDGKVDMERVEVMTGRSREKVMKTESKTPQLLRLCQTKSPVLSSYFRSVSEEQTLGTDKKGGESAVRSAAEMEVMEWWDDERLDEVDVMEMARLGSMEERRAHYTQTLQKEDAKEEEKRILKRVLDEKPYMQQTLSERRTNEWIVRKKKFLAAENEEWVGEMEMMDEYEEVEEEEEAHKDIKEEIENKRFDDEKSKMGEGRKGEVDSAERGLEKKTQPNWLNKSNKEEEKERRNSESHMTERQLERKITNRTANDWKIKEIPKLNIKSAIDSQSYEKVMIEEENETEKGGKMEEKRKDGEFEEEIDGKGMYSRIMMYLSERKDLTHRRTEGYPTFKEVLDGL
eukprot:MONOS_6040.1-p1 / transcript=MONOS_6040.1 / gene=MONOS_6040 / organism=Monocercomonoides_exilis_PA203 / gene_product=unspecified product / transcript_product=unspecified product / location=Mono_scaffold00185:29278-31759(+) / protein_length=731 / sequence_SO=supercontig / SO=protein_coding / is_pseudo=false